MADTEKLSVQELIELIKTNPDAFFYDKLGMRRPTPEELAEQEKDKAPLDYDAMRAAWGARIGRGGKTS